VCVFVQMQITLVDDSLDFKQKKAMLTDPSKQRQCPPPGFQCGEYYLEEHNDEVHRTVIFYCTLPLTSSAVATSADDETTSTTSRTTCPQHITMTFACRDRSVGVLETNERQLIIDQTDTGSDDDDHHRVLEEWNVVDPNFFDHGYTLAGRTGFQVWAATRIVLEALLFPLPGDCDRLVTIQQAILRPTTSTTTTTATKSWGLE
jgi:hypothetical protein